MSRKVVINKCYGGFSLSEAAYDFMHIKWDGYGYMYSYAEKEERENPDLVKCVETLGSRANGRSAKLKVITIPDDLEYTIENYDGIESVHENHRVFE